MHKNHGVWIAIAAGVAIAGTSYAASAVLFSEGNVESIPLPQIAESVESGAVDIAPSQPKETVSLSSAVEAPKPQSQPVSPTIAAPKATEPTRSVTPVYAEQQANPALAQAILRELPGYPCTDLTRTDEEAVRYFYTFEDLNDDGNDEAIAYLVGSYTCGTGGCTAMIFDVNGQEYTLNSRMTLVRTPIVVADSQTEGWHDLVIPVAGGGATPGDRLVTWTGQSYMANPSLAPEWTGASLEGVALIADSITADTSAPVLAGESCTP